MSDNDKKCPLPRKVCQQIKVPLGPQIPTGQSSLRIHNNNNCFDQEEEKQPGWSSTPMAELEKRKEMNEKAKDLVGQKVAFISHIPEAINKILETFD